MVATSQFSLRDAVDGPDGYATGLALVPHELERISGLIEAHWLGQLRERAPQAAGAFAEVGIARYHERSHLIDHASFWPKPARILPPEAVATIRRTSLLERLEAELGPFEISDEEDLGREEIYWRIVRPNEPSDTGPLHADRWFWDLGHGRAPAGRDRIKVWVAVVTEPGLSGLRLVAGSHLRDWRYHGEERDGMMKPQIDEDVDALAPRLVPTRPGDAVVFHDKLLHGGGLGRGEWTRISFEFTMFVAPRGR